MENLGSDVCGVMCCVEADPRAERGQTLTRCTWCWSGDAALTSWAGAQLCPKEINALPILTVVCIQRVWQCWLAVPSLLFVPEWSSLESLLVIEDFWTKSISSPAVILIRLFSHVCCTLSCYCCSDPSLIRKPMYLTAASLSKGFVLVPLT